MGPGGERLRVLSARALFLCLAWGLCGTAAAAPPTFTLSDPRGDDHGDGTLRYPRRGSYESGDLDLLSVSARPEKGGTLFEAVFARPIRKPGPEAIDGGGTGLDKVARFGFYTLNLDVYIDTDRVPGSGRRDLLPGRRAVMDSSTAWERAIVVTPRPYEAKEELQGMRFAVVKDSLARTSPRLDAELLRETRRISDAETDSTVFFPTRIRVVGPKLQFFVPDGFLGGPARDSWAYVVAVSGADLARRFDVDASFMLGKEFSGGLMILPVAPGWPDDRLGGGREDDSLQPPLIDVLISPDQRQEDALKDYDRRTGRPARLRGAVPATGRAR